MALENDTKLPIGLSLENAYIRIDTIGGYKNGLNMTVNTYVSRETFLEGSSFVEQNNIHFVPSIEKDSENFIKQGYEYLKTLPKYEGSKNVPSDGGPD